MMISSQVYVPRLINWKNIIAGLCTHFSLIVDECDPQKIGELHIQFGYERSTKCVRRWLNVSNNFEFATAHPQRCCRCQDGGHPSEHLEHFAQHFGCFWQQLI